MQARYIGGVQSKAITRAAASSTMPYGHGVGGTRVLTARTKKSSIVAALNKLWVRVTHVKDEIKWVGPPVTDWISAGPDVTVTRAQEKRYLKPVSRSAQQATGRAVGWEAA